MGFSEFFQAQGDDLGARWPGDPGFVGRLWNSESMTDSAVRSLVGVLSCCVFPPHLGWGSSPVILFCGRLKRVNATNQSDFIRKKCVESVFRWPLDVERWCQMVAAAIDSLAQRAAFVIFLVFKWEDLASASLIVVSYRFSWPTIDQATGVIVSAQFMGWIPNPLD